MAKTGRPRKYTGKMLAQKVDEYFASISRVVEMYDDVPTDKRDEHGHVIFSRIPVLNRLGERASRIEFFTPPTIGGLCEHLGIDRSTWATWSDAEKYPEFFETITRARGRIRAYLEEQLLSRSGKDVKGVIFDLEVNHGVKQVSEVELHGGIEDFLRQIDAAEREGGDAENA